MERRLMSIPTSREDLDYAFRNRATKLLDRNKDITIEDFSNKLIPDLVELVPGSAFEPTQPFEKGFLFYHGQIEEENVPDFQHDLLRVHMNLEKDNPMMIYLSSFGGSVYAGLTFIATVHELQRDKRLVHMHVQGLAASMASFVLQAANFRTMEDTALLMLHEISYRQAGSVSDHEEEQKSTAKLQDILYGIYTSRTGRGIEYYRDKLKKKQIYLNAQEALEEGLIDAIIPSPNYEEMNQKAIAKSIKKPKTVVPKNIKVK